MKFIFFRHGQTVANTQQVFQGVSDTPLTDQGIKQAKAMNNYLKKQTIEKFIISPLLRVEQTYKIASQEIYAPVEKSDFLREMSYGEWEQKTKTEVKANTLPKRTANKYAFIHPGSYNNAPGESYKSIYENRVVPFLNNLLKQQFKNDIVIISHLGIMRGIKRYFCKLTDDETAHEHLDNHIFFVVEKNSNGKSVFSQHTLSF